jgi:hypothetical protein
MARLASHQILHHQATPATSPRSRHLQGIWASRARTARAPARAPARGPAQALARRDPARALARLQARAMRGGTARRHPPVASSKVGAYGSFRTPNNRHRRRSLWHAAQSLPLAIGARRLFSSACKRLARRRDGVLYSCCCSAPRPLPGPPRRIGRAGGYI